LREHHNKRGYMLLLFSDFRGVDNALRLGQRSMGGKTNKKSNDRKEGGKRATE
jgi:hypothetical protein